MPTPTDLFITEYVEPTSGTTKIIEIFNGTGSAIDLAALGYVLQQFQNGGATPGATIALTGTIASGDVYVVSGAAFSNPNGAADLVTTSLNFNGDDAIVLRRGGAGGTIIDVIGQIGVDPGTEWGTGLTSTADNVLRRKSVVSTGDANGADAFDPATEFDGFVATDTSDVGRHTFTGGGATVSIGDVSLTEGDAGTKTLTFTVSRSDDAGTFSLDYATADGAAASSADYVAATGTLSFTAGGALTQNVSVTINGDTTFEGNETFLVNLTNLQNTTGTAAIGDAQATGTITNDDASPFPIITISPATISQNDVNSGVTTYTYTISRAGPTTDAVEVAYAVTGSGSAPANGADFAGSALPTGTVTIAAGATSAPLVVNIAADVAAESSEGFAVTLSNATGGGATLGSPTTASGTILNDDATLISTVQGSGTASALAGQTVTVEAIVVGDFQNGDADNARNLGGFFLQEVVGDGNAATSDGIFIFQNGIAFADVAEGSRVRVTGTVNEFNGSTQITATAVDVIQAGQVSDVSTLAVTAAIPGDLERYEGMLVTVPQTQVISEQFNLDQFGEVRLYASEGDGLAGAVAEGPNGRPYQFTQINEPDVAANAAYIAAVAARSIVYDDGLSASNQPIGLLDGFQSYGTPGAPGAPQMGDSIAGLTGVLDFGFGSYRIRAVDDGDNTFADTNPREAAPADVGGRLTVGGFNVLNFFATLDANNANIENGQDPRGANSDAEFGRQVEKLVTTIVALDADVLGLIELENDFFDDVPGDTNRDGNAIEYLVEQVNARLGSEVYSYVDPGAETIGGDAIAVGYIYQNAAVRIAPGTNVAVNLDDDFRRPPVAVTFEEIATGEDFTAVVNHFKSKSAAGATGADLDQNDGQGAFNAERAISARTLTDWVATNPTGTSDSDVILLGDFNSYYQEDPIDVLRAAGFDPVFTRTDYSYTFDGQIGTLDYALANTSIRSQITGFTEWHINSDEADALNYNLDFSRLSSYFDGTIPYSVSDHDPILVGLSLDSVAPTLTASTPADNASAVAAGSNIVLTFSEAVRAGTGNIVISDGAGDTRTFAIGDTSQVTVSGNTITLNPTADLAAGRAYDVTVASGVITDASGIAFAGLAQDQLDFTVAVQTPPVDTLAPSLVSTNPVDNATGVAAGSNIILSFSEAVRAGTGSIVIANGAGDTRAIAVTDASQVSFSANTVTLNPTADLVGGTSYDVTIASGVITDAAGNGFAGIVQDALDFGVARPVPPADTTAPTLVSSSPADNAAGVASGSNIVLSFSETVRAGNGSIVIANGAGDTRTIAIADRAQVGISGSTVTINPTENLSIGASYDVTFAPGVITDLSGNAFTGIAQDALDFTIGSSATAGNDTIVGGPGNDIIPFNPSAGGSDTVNLGAGSDIVNVSAASPGQVRLTFTSAQVGNGNPNDAAGPAPQDGGLAVRLQAEDAGGALAGAVSRFDDEGTSFVAAAGTTFDVRDLVSGVQRGDAFEVVTLGTSGNDTLTAVQGARPYYFNAGAGDDSVTGGTANDFLVGGGGNDTLSGAAGNDSFIGGAGNDSFSGGTGTDRAIFTFALSAATVGAAADGATTITSPDGTDTFRGIEEFQFSDRTISNADGSPLVDDLFYLSRNPDVAAAGVDADTHYAEFGFREGRDPNAFFSTDGYLAANPDVRAAGLNPLTHYDQFGFREGRDPGANFDNEAYYARNADVRAAGVDPLAHFLEFGQAEGRTTNTAIGRASDIGAARGFDAEFYLLSNSDVADAAIAAGGDSFAFARNHYNNFGVAEGRDPNAIFDTDGYLNAYADVRAAGANPLTHYDQFGFREGRDPSIAFDTSAYLAANPDVQAAGIDPMVHYLQFGFYEGRSAQGDTTFGAGNVG